MSRKTKSPGFFAILMHIVLVFMTAGAWLVVLGYYYTSSAVYGRRPSILSVVGNTFMFLITGGLWIFVSLVWYLTRK